MVENTVDAIVEELTDNCSRTFEGHSIFALLNCASHINTFLKFIEIKVIFSTKI